jgi:hypothetical protein
VRHETNPRGLDLAQRLQRARCRATGDGAEGVSANHVTRGLPGSSPSTIDSRFVHVDSAHARTPPAASTTVLAIVYAASQTSHRPGGANGSKRITPAHADRGERVGQEKGDVPHPQRPMPGAVGHRHHVAIEGHQG